MEQVRVERLDHLGLIASVMKDLGLIAMIDRRLVPDEQEVITPGEAIAGMILNGLGFANRPLSLTPQFFANKPLDLLCRDGIKAEMFNRFKLGRTLDEAHAYGCNLLFEELALAVWTSGRIQTENYGFKVFAVPSALLNVFSGHFTVQLDQICIIGSLFHGHTTYCRTRCYAKPYIPAQMRPLVRPVRGRRTPLGRMRRRAGSAVNTVDSRDPPRRSIPIVSFPCSRLWTRLSCCEVFSGKSARIVDVVADATCKLAD